MNEIDSRVGNRVRQRRENLGISQRQLAKVLGTSYQQLQKYECGRNRLPVSRLFALSSILNVSVTYFFDHHDRAAPRGTPSAAVGSIEDRPESRELNAAFMRLRTKALRRSVIAFVEAVAGHEECRGGARRRITR